MVPARLRLVFSLGVFAIGFRTASANPLEYEMTFLPVPPGCQALSQFHGLDEQDRVLGTISCDGFVTQRAVLWDQGDLLELGTFGGPNSFPYGLSVRGAVVGYAETSEIYAGDQHVWRPFLWTDGHLHDLGTLGGALGAAASLNGGETIVGICQPAEEDPRILRTPTRACLWEGASVMDLGDLGGPEVFASDINSRGWTVGSSNTPEALPSGLGFVQHAFLHDGHGMIDLGTLGGLESAAISLNDKGHATGWSITAERWRNGYPIGHAFLWRDGIMLDLPHLDGPFSMGFDINARDEIVGFSYRLAPNGYPEQRAVLWEGGAIVDLNDVLCESNGWTLQQATAIDSRGRILANADRDGESRIVLLIPTRQQ